MTCTLEKSCLKIIVIAVLTFLFMLPLTIICIRKLFQRFCVQETVKNESQDDFVDVDLSKCTHL